MCVSIYIIKCNIQHLNNSFNKFKVNDSTHVEMLIIQKIWKKLLHHQNIITKHWVACVSIYFNKCKMQLVSNNFNILNVNGLNTHVDNWRDVEKNHYFVPIHEWGLKLLHVF
jgi:hypothetical protein